MGEDLCDTGLGLAIGGRSFSDDHGGHRRCSGSKQSSMVGLQLWFPSCTVEEKEEEEKTASSVSVIDVMEKPRSKNKHEKDNDEGDDEEQQHVARKKLRLTKEQSAILEESFRANNTLNPLQKQELAQRLALLPRQVEVWFQNRRARTKLKQIEVECEVLKRWCDGLRDENTRLRRELQETRLYGEISKMKAVRVVCPSCRNRLMSEEDDDDGKEENKCDGFAKSNKKR
ncbi:hypothetical protein HPP92_010231 [Vanilla planifolia]|uniref:Homeobox domain-containing protein n=1 Tax=Vanilla planifolia TaxID=51239 RepID=A0A835R8Z0_VANPL|nr:hypothetical protein HPP92_010231 [Vanilla planifolia]